MDARRFDRVVKTLGSATSRRRMLRGLLAGVGGERRCLPCSTWNCRGRSMRDVPGFFSALLQKRWVL
jgi:hypothetical protein